MKKKFKIIIPTIILLFIFFTTVYVIKYNNTKNGNEKLAKTNIEEVLKTDAYNYLSSRVKDYIRDVYYENGYILLTEKNKEKDKEYLNPEFIKYLESNKEYAVIPSNTIVDYVPTKSSGDETYPAKYDLRNVDGKNYVTPFKNQGQEGLCWDFATNAHLESYMLVKNKKSYDSTATILSEQQLDYASSNNGSSIENNLYNFSRGLSDGGSFIISENLMLDGMITVKKDWDDAHTTEIDNKSPIERADIFNFNNSLYELNTSYNFPSFDYLSATVNERTSYLNSIKDNIMKYGGAWVSTDVCYDSVNMYNGSEIRVVDVMKDGGCVTPGPHALQIIGWDDDFEWKVCKKSHGNATPPQDCGTSGYVSGKGVWILKNSWGDYQSIVLLAYESVGTDIHFVADLSEKTWNNIYKTDKTYVNSTTSTFKVKPNAYVGSEKLKKIKVDLDQNTTNKFYFNDTKIGEITTTYKGYYTLDVSANNLAFTKDSVIKLVTTGRSSSILDLRLYTSNSNTVKSVFTEDIVYDRENEYLNSTNYFDFYLYTQTKNIPNHTDLTFKIKDSDGNYVSEDYYSYEYNKVYANTGYTKLTIDSDHFSKGEYTIETYYDEINYNTSKFNINIDLFVSGGDGSSENPWRIYNAKQFNTIRNNPNDSFILMNDIDFEYDTKNEKGILYNDGFGFEAINDFHGFLDGNGYQIKNVYSKSEVGSSNNEIRVGGIFNRVGVTNCQLEQCGFKNIIVSNPDIIGSYSTGGFINNIDIYDNEKFIFENISVIGGNITNLEQPTYQLGGIIGSLYSYADSSNAVTIKNLYSSANVKGSSNVNKYFKEQIGGIIGIVGGGEFGDGTLSISNLMFEGNLSHSTYYDNVGGSLLIAGGAMWNLELDNIISLNEDFDAVGFTTDIDSYSYEFSMKINNVYTTSRVGFNEEIAKTYLVSSDNIISNQSIFELANANYSKWKDFNKNWNQYDEDGIKRIPVIKGVPYGYFGMENEVTIKQNQSIDVLNLITNSDYNDDFEISNSCNYNLDICDNVSNGKIASLQGTTIKGLKDGDTTFIVSNKHDGFISLLTVHVDGKKDVTFNSNGGVGEMSKQTFTSGSEVTLKKNNFTKENYYFVHWNTKSDDSGISYDDEAKVTLTDDIELYAIWKESVSLNKEQIELYVGQSETLIPTVLPEDENAVYSWSSSSNKIARVSSNGIVLAVKKGTATITVKTEKGSATCTVVVHDALKVSYSTHVQTYGWKPYVYNGATSGTEGEAKRLEGIKIKLDNNNFGGGIEYRTHVQTYGWEKTFKKDNEVSGTQGESKRLEAIEIKLTGEVANKFDVYYRVHAQTFGWLGWAKNGESAGTAGLSKRLEAIQIKLVEKDTPFSEYGKSSAYKEKHIEYNTHVQTYGWQDYSYDGLMAGTQGEGKRLEAIKIRLANQKYDGSVLYRTHIQSYGWEESWKKNGNPSGTEGEGKRLEAIEIKLDGEMADHYDIYYRVHAQTYGWLNWAKNGEKSGTAGLAKRLEAIEIVLVDKGEEPPTVLYLHDRRAYIENTQ